MVCVCVCVRARVCVCVNSELIERVGTLVVNGKELQRGVGMEI
jgi:hypothetical protein